MLERRHERDVIREPRAVFERSQPVERDDGYFARAGA